MRGHRGFTLIETLMVIVVVSLAGLIAFPKFSQALRTSNLNSAKAKVTTLYASARATSAGSGRVAYLHLAGNNVYVKATPRRTPGAGTWDTLTPVENLYTQYGVGLASSRDSVRIDQSGLGRDSTVIVLTKGSQTTTIRISPFGRILK